MVWNKIPIPERFKEDYLGYKRDEISDRVIAEEIYFVSLKCFNRWKRDSGLIGVSNQGGQNRKIDYKLAKIMKDNGFKPREIAREFSCTVESVRRAIKMMK